MPSQIAPVKFLVVTVARNITFCCILKLPINQNVSKRPNASTTDNPETQTTLTSTSDKAIPRSDQGRTVALLGTCRLAVEDKVGLAQQLQLPRRGTKTAIYNLGSSAPKPTIGVVTVTIRPQNQPLVLSEMHVNSKITNTLPSQPIDVKTIDIIKDLHLADKSFAHPGSIDKLIGVELMNQITTNDRFQGKDLTFTRTIFGWVITGRAEVAKFRDRNSPSKAVCNFLQTNSAQVISKLSCTEEVPSTTPSLTEAEMVTKKTL